MTAAQFLCRVSGMFTCMGPCGPIRTVRLLRFCDLEYTTAFDALQAFSEKIVRAARV